MNEILCDECGAKLIDADSCREYLNEMIKWDFEDFLGVGKVHHLTVLSYNLQHPSVYSVKGLQNAKETLVEFIKNPTQYATHGAYDREKLASDVRDWKISGTPESHAEYATRPQWHMLASKVVRGGLGNYVDNVIKWNETVLCDLRDTGNLT
jgi:hypothetical protein